MTLNLAGNPAPVLTRLNIAFACLLLFFALLDLIKIRTIKEKDIDIDLINYYENKNNPDKKKGCKVLVYEKSKYIFLFFRPAAANIFSKKKIKKICFHLLIVVSISIFF